VEKNERPLEKSNCDFDVKAFCKKGDDLMDEPTLEENKERSERISVAILCATVLISFLTLIAIVQQLGEITPLAWLSTNRAICES
jgi:hypothetical protein